MKLNNLDDRTFLLGVGAQKAGTTWLYNYLRSHPEIFMSPIKEMHFFGNRNSGKSWPIPAFRRKLHKRMEQNPFKKYTALRERINMKDDMSKYIDFFKTRIRNEPVFGEISPIYSELDIDELNFIKSSFPSTKLIFLLRNPADRLWSQLRISGDYNAADDPSKLRDVILQKPPYLSRSNYSATVKNLQQVFSPANIHYEFYETLFCPDAIKRICSFLNVDYFPAKFDARYNVSIKAQLGLEQRQILVNLLRDQYAFAFQEFGDRVPECWKADAC